MFTIENKHPFIDGLYDINANYCSLLNDGDNDILYTGTNKYCSRILGSILFEDDEELFLRYIQIIITDELFFDFLNKKISLRGIINTYKSLFIVDKNYNNEIIRSSFVPLSDIPEDFLPLNNSFCPEFVKKNTLDYTFSLKGGLADIHKAEPLVMSDTNTKIFSLLKASSNFLEELNIQPKIYSEVALAGSFELNFQIELIEETNLFSQPNEDIKKFIYKFYNYIFEKLPNEPINVLKDELGATNELKTLFIELNEIHEKRKIKFNEEATEQKVVDMITYSVDALKNLEYKGFDRIEVGNKISNVEKCPVGLIKTDYYSTVIDKVFKPEEINKPDEIVLDPELKQYKIQVYSLNKETGNGSVYYIEDRVLRVSLHLKGRDDYHGTIFTKSLDENNLIEVKAIGKRVNGILKEITIDLK